MKEWLTTIPDGELLTNQKIEGYEECFLYRKT
jgi:hypothetical protein